MTHLLEIIQVTKLKENCGKGIVMQQFRNGEEGLILKYCFAWTNVLAGVILCYGNSLCLDYMKHLEAIQKQHFQSM